MSILQIPEKILAKNDIDVDKLRKERPMLLDNILSSMEEYNDLITKHESPAPLLNYAIQWETEIGINFILNEYKAYLMHGDHVSTDYPTFVRRLSKYVTAKAKFVV